MMARSARGETDAGAVDQAVSHHGIDTVDEPDTANEAAPPGSPAVWRRDAFWPDTVHACAPLAIWAGHFFGSYAFVAIGCRAHLDSQAVLGLPLLTLGLLALTAGALGWLALLLLGRNGLFRLRRKSTQGRQRGEPPPARYPPGATAFRSGAAALSLVAVAWTTPPMLLLTSCLQ